MKSLSESSVERYFSSIRGRAVESLSPTGVEEATWGETIGGKFKEGELCEAKGGWSTGRGGASAGTSPASVVDLLNGVRVREGLNGSS